jgi:hypothetical protein
LWAIASNRTTGNGGATCPNLDTFAWYTGRLAIGVFDDAAPGGPIEVLEVHGERFDKIEQTVEVASRHKVVRRLIQ